MHELTKDCRDFLNKNKGKKIVFTNGCFDLLHRGHLTYLCQAKQLGDLLIIGLNSDSSVKKLKGESRPIFNEKDRKFMLESLKMVDFVEIFFDEVPVDLVDAVKPDIYVKGGDYEIETIPEYKVVKAYGGQVKKLSFVDGHSSTSIINKIKQLKAQ